MIRSMTGFGRGKYECDGREYLVEIKSVNHKYIDINVRIPKNISFLEAVKKYFKEFYGSDIAGTKPNLEGFKMACGNYKMEECIMIGDNLKTDINEIEGQKIIVKGSLGRSKAFEKEATIEKTYPNIFIVKYEENNRTVSFNYTDVLTRTVELEVFDGENYNPLLPPI